MINIFQLSVAKPLDPTRDFQFPQTPSWVPGPPIGNPGYVTAGYEVFASRATQMR